MRGYRLRGETYEPVTDGRSQPLQLRLVVEGKLIGFYREDTGEKLLIPDELASALQQAEEIAEQERQQRELATQQLAQMQAMLDRYRERFGDLP